MRKLSENSASLQEQLRKLDEKRKLKDLNNLNSQLRQVQSQSAMIPLRPDDSLNDEMRKNQAASSMVNNFTMNNNNVNKTVDIPSVASNNNSAPTESSKEKKGMSDKDKASLIAGIAQGASQMFGGGQSERSPLNLSGGELSSPQDYLASIQAPKFSTKEFTPMFADGGVIGGRSISGENDVELDQLKMLELEQLKRAMELEDYNKKQRILEGGEAMIPIRPESEGLMDNEMRKNEIAKGMSNNAMLVDKMGLPDIAKPRSPIQNNVRQPSALSVGEGKSSEEKTNDLDRLIKQYESEVNKKREVEWQDILSDALAGLHNVINYATGSQQKNIDIGHLANKRKMDSESDKNKKQDLLDLMKLYNERSKIDKQKTVIPKISKVTESFERELGKELPNWATARQNAISNIQKVENAINMLENKSDALTSGPLAGRLPTVRTSTKDIETSIQGSVVDTLRSILGAQFTEQEGERIKALAYDPTLEPEQNLPRAKRILEELKTRLKSKDDMVNYYNRFGTLQGYDVDISKPSQNPYRPSEGPQGDVVERNGKTYKWNPSRGKYQLISK